MNGVFGHKISTRCDNSFDIPVFSIMSQNGPFKISEARKCTPRRGQPSRRKSKPGSHGNKVPPTHDGGQTKCYEEDAIEKLIESVMATCLQDVTYDAETCIQMSQSVAGTVMEKIKPFSSGHYKLVVVVSIGNSRQTAGLQFGSRCLWNRDADSFLSVKYSNESLFAVAMVYSLLFE